MAPDLSHPQPPQAPQPLDRPRGQVNRQPRARGSAEPRSPSHLCPTSSDKAGHAAPVPPGTGIAPIAECGASVEGGPSVQAHRQRRAVGPCRHGRGGGQECPNAWTGAVQLALAFSGRTAAGMRWQRGQAQKTGCESSAGSTGRRTASTSSASASTGFDFRSQASDPTRRTLDERGTATWKTLPNFELPDENCEIHRLSDLQARTR